MFHYGVWINEHWPRREAKASCYGRGRSAALRLASTGDVFSATLSHPLPCGTSMRQRQIRAEVDRVQGGRLACQARKGTRSQSGVGKSLALPRLASANHSSIEDLKEKLPLSLLLHFFSS